MALRSSPAALEAASAGQGLNDSKAAVIVQARFSSTRLPGKVLLPLGGQTALAQCLRRCQAIPGIDVVVCAVPEGAVDDPVAEEAAKCGAVVVRGSGADVLARYRKAALAVEAAWIMRVTSDCPLIDPKVCGEILRLARDRNLDFASNNMPATWPHGFDAEVFSFAMLDQAFRNATDPFDREHVTPWIRNRKDVQKGNVARDGESLAETCRWTLDYPEDYQFLQALFELLPHDTDLDTVLSVLQAHPELTKINAQHHGVRAKK